MKIRVDFELCESHARCVEAAPEIFSIDDSDQLVVRTARPEQEHWEAVRDAIRRCPRRAIDLDE